MNPRTVRKLNPREPVEALLAPERLGESVAHLDRFDPFRILVAELGRGAQPQRIAERIGEHVARIFGGEDGLRMQRGLPIWFHVDDVPQTGGPAPRLG